MRSAILTVPFARNSADVAAADGSPSARVPDSSDTLSYPIGRVLSGMVPKHCRQVRDPVTQKEGTDLPGWEARSKRPGHSGLSY